jgi:hypothetical protein
VPPMGILTGDALLQRFLDLPPLRLSYSNPKDIDHLDGRAKYVQKDNEYFCALGLNAR